MSKKLPKILRRDARVLIAIELHEGPKLHYLDWRPRVRGGAV